MNAPDLHPHDEVDPVDPDPTLLAWLDFLGREMDRHPERVIPAAPEWVERMLKLADGIEVDLDESIEGPVPL